MELSLVPIPADPAAQTRSHQPRPEGTGMDTQTAALAAPATALAAADPIAVERARAAGIVTLARKLSLGDAFAQQHVASGTGLDAAREAAFELVAARQEATPTHSQRVELVADHDAPDAMQRAMGLALAHKASAGAVPLAPEAQRFVGCSQADLARTFLEHRGERVTGRSGEDVLKRAWKVRGGGHTTSDFAGVYETATQAIVLTMFDRSRSELLAACSRVTVPDLQKYRRIRLGEGPMPKKINQQGEVTYGATGEEYEYGKVDSYAINANISREMQLNDRNDQWGQFLMNYGQGAAALEAKLIADVFTGNPNLRDGTAVWDAAARGNDNTTPATLGAASLQSARATLRGFKNVNKGEPLNLGARFLIVPAALEGDARVYMASEYLAAPSTGANPVRGMAEVLVDPRLDVASTKRWWLFPGPDVAPVVEVAHLDGTRAGSSTDGAPVVETFSEADTLGLTIRLVYDVGVAAVGWRSVRSITP
jgi:hypothetical protein